MRSKGTSRGCLGGGLVGKGAGNGEGGYANVIEQKKWSQVTP